MKKIISTLLLLFLYISSSNAEVNIHNVKYIRNYDGDTITVTIPNFPPIAGEKVGVRLRGIDTPEIRGGCSKSKALAKKAKNEVTYILKNATTIKLKNVSRGKYFRYVATVIVDGVNLNELLIKKKLAKVYDGGKKSDWCAN